MCKHHANQYYISPFVQNWAVEEPCAQEQNALPPFAAEGRICSTIIPTQKALPTASREDVLEEDQKR